MKETRYKDLVGFEEKNTFVQFDQFETQSLYGAKNRNIYDFSHPIKPFSNLSVFGAGYTTSFYGQPGDQCSFVTDKVQDNGSVIVDALTWDREATVNEDEYGLYFNENAFGYLDEKTTDAFGLVKKADWVDYFRSGYLEFTIKTDKKNCIIASGSTEIKVEDLYTVIGIFGASVANGVSITSLFKNDTAVGEMPRNIDNPYFQANSFDSALLNLDIEIIDGKIMVNYYDLYNRENVSYQFIGNEDIADNKWHHIVINFGRPGLIKDSGVKFNKKFVEIWVDSVLDKRFDDKVNDFNIFYPKIEFLFNSIKNVTTTVLDSMNIVEDYDRHPAKPYSDVYSVNDYVGLDDRIGGINLFYLGVASQTAKQKAFRGSIHTFAHGVNIPISKYEIKKRFSLWKKNTKDLVDTMTCSAEMVSPSILTNSKKALKLYWNMLTDQSKNGIELDNTFQTESYSITHKTKNSKTEVFNFDKKELTDNNILPNVRLALSDNILVMGPSNVMTWNTEEAIPSLTAYGNTLGAWHPKNINLLDTATSLSNYKVSAGSIFAGTRNDLTYSGVSLNNGDRVLLTGQAKTEENGIWIFNGIDKQMTRSVDCLNFDSNKQNIVYVTDGIYSKTYWKLESFVNSLAYPQKWILVDSSNVDNVSVSPVNEQRWKTYRGEDRFINVLEDIDLSRYSLITFMNYPETNEEIFDHFPEESTSYVFEEYKKFINSLVLAAAGGSSIFVSSKKLAEDMGIVKKFTEIDQNIDDFDNQSATINPFETNEDATNYFDNNRINRYSVATEVAGLTDKETYVLTNFINYIPSNVYDDSQYHAQYSYRQFGIKEGNEFIIPTLPLAKFQTNKLIPGFRQNARTTIVNCVKPTDILAGTVVTALSNTYYDASGIVANPYDDYATTIIVHNNQTINGIPITGKIFVNCTEDSYTMSRKEYNYGIIQTIPQNDNNESTATRAWQYSTTRLNKKQQKVNVKNITNNGQVIPTNGGGGAIIQAPTNSSNGIIKSETFRSNPDYMSDLYADESEEIYPTQKIPVLSMTWLGLQWLAE